MSLKTSSFRCLHLVWIGLGDATCRMDRLGSLVSVNGGSSSASVLMRQAASQYFDRSLNIEVLEQ